MMIASLKIIPAIMAVSQFMGPLCAYLGVGFLIGTHYLGLFLAPMMYLYMSSIVFKFCWYHRIFIWYMLLSEGLTITDWYFRIPISNEAICMVLFAIAAAFVLGVAVYYILKYLKKWSITHLFILKLKKILKEKKEIYKTRVLPLLKIVNR